MISEIIDYLMLPAHVQRVVTPLYFIIVILITSSVLYYCVRTNNKNAIRLFLFSLIVWPIIEGIGLITGWRVYYSGNNGLIYFLVAMVEDPGWVALGYVAAEKMYDKWFKNKEE